MNEKKLKIKKDTNLNIRISRVDKEKIESLARKKGFSVSKYVIFSCLNNNGFLENVNTNEDVNTVLEIKELINFFNEIAKVNPGIIEEVKNRIDVQKIINIIKKYME